MRRIGPPAFDPDAAREWRSYAAYLARVEFGSDATSDDELRALAERQPEHEASERILRALEWAAEGRAPCNPYLAFNVVRP